MSRVETLLAPLAGYRSDQVARYVWQLDELRRSLLFDVAGLSPSELRWQPRPGMNTIGMLLAHIAYAESHLVQVGLERKQASDTRSVIGITEEDEGMPLAAGAPPSPMLDRLTLDEFVDMLARARAYTKRVASVLEDGDLDHRVVRRRPDGTERVFNLGWVFYHLLEHEAGHRAQINLLKHLGRAMKHA